MSGAVLDKGVVTGLWRGRLEGQRAGEARRNA